MKRIYFYILVLSFSQMLSAQNRHGRILDEYGNAVDFATIVLFDGEKQAAVAVADTAGQFVIFVGNGNYKSRISHLAYEPLEQSVLISDKQTDLGTFVMKESDVGLGEVVVTSRSVIREADRFVMLMNNTPMLMNKDASEVLRLAPGVWVDDNGISINGSGGAKVFINDRELKLTGKELTDYLRNFRSSDISKIEIVPQAGAAYSADSRSGIVKISLRKQLENGLNGNIQATTLQGKYVSDYAPSATLNARMGHWTLNALASYKRIQKGKVEYDASRIYAAESDRSFSSVSSANQQSHSGLGRFGLVFEPDARNSVGAELEFMAKDMKNPSSAKTFIHEGGYDINGISDYRQEEKNGTLSATFNYVHRLDSSGSSLKFIADYTKNEVTGDNGYYSLYTMRAGSTDSTYRNNSSSLYRIYTADFSFNKQLQRGMKYAFGAKYMRNDMTDSVLYESFKTSQWHNLDDYSYSLDYTENISAFYGVFAAEFGRVGLSAGLRGEYVITRGKTGHDIRRSSFDLFPNVSLTYAFDDMKTFMLIGQYARNVERPNFWYLNPNRVQSSDYSYSVGNPNLRMTYIHRASMTAVYNYRYTLTVGGNMHHDLVREVCKIDPSNPEITYIIPENHHSENHFFVAVNAPLQLAKWWNLNTNIIGLKQDIRGTESDSRMSHYLYFVNLTSSFSLPAKLYLELVCSETSRLYSSNSGINPRSLFHVSVKKQLLNDRLTASLGLNNIFNNKVSYFSNTGRFRVNTEGYEGGSSRFFKVALQYNFRAGKAFKSKKVESGSGEEKNRLKKSINAK